MKKMKRLRKQVNNLKLIFSIRQNKWLVITPLRKYILERFEKIEEAVKYARTIKSFLKYKPR